jgi:hypothetical protein
MSAKKQDPKDFFCGKYYIGDIVRKKEQGASPQG